MPPYAVYIAVLPRSDEGLANLNKSLECENILAEWKVRYFVRKE